MGRKLTTIIIVLFWLISFVEPSGWAEMVHLANKVNLTIAVLALLFYMRVPAKRLHISTNLFFFVVLSYIVIPFVTTDSEEGMSYLVAFLAMYIVSQGTMVPSAVKYSAIAIGLLGLVVMYIYTKGSLLSGWNDNAISMVGLFSFAYFSIYLIQCRGKKIFWILNIITLCYIQMLFETDCRSGMMFSIVTVICILLYGYLQKFLASNTCRLLLLNLPLIIALIVIAISSSPYFEALDTWSIEKFNKPVFNGRDELWDLSLIYLDSTDYLGTGKFLMNYHNSGIAALTVFGILGYICWIKLFSVNLSEMKHYLSDEIVLGSMLAFFIIFIQQTVDLGFISSVPNLLPYTILGVGLGRVRYLKNEEG